MPFIFLYILKLSVSLAVVFLFYQLVLRKLTFYSWNRWYLLGYTLLCLFIPFIDITPVLKSGEWTGSHAVTWVPILAYGPDEPEATKVSGHYNSWNLFWMIMAAGMLIMVVRLLIQLISFYRMIKKAKAITREGMNLYQVDESIIPFSFGNSIFINQHLHSDEELQEIIRHEFVHVKQRHSIDIVWTEILCIINWYNPFAWLIKRSIRQNLEFIADNKVLENGINKKQYQYLLLKVIGNNQFSIAPKFNFSSLKKRIAMMNKMKSAKRQLLRLLFLLPATAILLLAFRNKWKDPGKNENDERKVSIAGLIVDARTMKPLTGANIFCKEKNITAQTDDKGYYLLQLPYENKPLQFSLEVSKEGFTSLHQQENWGNFYSDKIRTLYGNTFEFFGLGKTGEKDHSFSTIGGNADTKEGLRYSEAVKKFGNISLYPGNFEVTDTLPPPPIPPVPPVPPTPPSMDNQELKAFLKRNPDIKNIEWSAGDDNENQRLELHIARKDGTTETYNLNNPGEKAMAEKKYGKMPIPQLPPPPPPPHTTVQIAPVGFSAVGGQTIAVTTGVSSPVTTAVVEPSISVGTNLTGTKVRAVNSVTTTLAAPVGIGSGTTLIGPAKAAIAGEGLTIAGDDYMNAIDDKDVLVTITRYTTRQQLEEYKKQAKEKGVELNYGDIQYNDKGFLVYISGTMDSKDGRSNFVANSFEKLLVVMTKDDGRTHFRVIVKGKEVI